MILLAIMKHMIWKGQLKKNDILKSEVTEIVIRVLAYLSFLKGKSSLSNLVLQSLTCFLSQVVKISVLHLTTLKL